MQQFTSRRNMARISYKGAVTSVSTAKLMPFNNS